MENGTYKIKILGCKNKSFWYADKIGQVFECKENEEILNPLVHTVNDTERPEGGWRHILPEDCREMSYDNNRRSRSWQDDAEESRKI